LAFCLCICHSSYAQETNEQDTISTIVVSGSRKLPVVLQSTMVQNITHEEFEKLGLHQVYEAVQSFAGARVKDYGGIGGIKTVSIRSLGAQHTSVSYDGVTISNLQSGQVDISRFSLENIDQVTLTIGQSDNIFQSARSSASAGNLEITTATPRLNGQKASASVTLQAASFGTYSPKISYNQALGKRWSLNINGEYLTSNGDYPYRIVNGSTIEDHIRKNSDVESMKGEVNLYGQLGKGSLTFKTNIYSSERGLPGSIVLYNEDSNERLWDKNIFSQLSYSTPISKKWDFKTYLKYSYDWNRYLDKSASYATGEEDDRYRQDEIYGSFIVRYKPSEYLNFTLAEDLFENKLESNIPECQYPIRLTSITALSGQYRSTRLTASATLLGTITKESVENGDPADNRQRLSPSFGISYKLIEDKELRLRASFKKLYRIPTFDDLYYSRVGNRNLKPEKADQYNVGLTYAFQNTSRENSIFFDHFSASIDGYYNIVKDKIVSIPTMFIWRMMNMDRVNIKGCDIDFESKIVAGPSLSFDLNLNYSLQKAIDISNPESKSFGHQIPYAPVHSGGAQIAISTPWVNFGYILSAVGKRYSLPQNVERNLIEGYFDHNLSIYKLFNLLGSETLLQAEVVNLTNKMYEVIKYYPMPGRSFRLTIKIKV